MAALLRANAWSGKPRKRRTTPKYPCATTWGWLPVWSQANDEHLVHKAKEPPPDAIGINQTDRGTCGLYRTIGELERARANRCVDGSRVANPRPGAAP